LKLILLGENILLFTFKHEMMNKNNKKRTNENEIRYKICVLKDIRELKNNENNFINIFNKNIFSVEFKRNSLFLKLNEKSINHMLFFQVLIDSKVYWIEEFLLKKVN
jgi:hypothetical protein